MSLGLEMGGQLRIKKRFVPDYPISDSTVLEHPTPNDLPYRSVMQLV